METEISPKQKINNCGDGNCLFYSIAQGIFHRLYGKLPETHVYKNFAKEGLNTSKLQFLGLLIKQTMPTQLAFCRNQMQYHALMQISQKGVLQQ